MTTGNTTRRTDKLTIFDTTLRDGEQTPGVSLSTRQKLEVAGMLEQLGVDVIEAGFPASSPGAMEAVAAVAAQVSGAAVSALARCHEGDIRAAAEALKPARRPRMHIFIATSPTHMRHKLKMTSQQVMEKAAQGIRLALEHCPDVEFSAEDATRSEERFLDDIVAMAAELGVGTINIPDTVGYTTPEEYARTIGRLCEVVRGCPSTVISVHCHDDLGLAAANSLAGIRAGARQVECTINGLGERAGNAALEEVVMATRTRPDLWQVSTGIHTELLTLTSQRVARMTGVVVPPNKAVVGANAFAHASGIHQHGVIGHASTYEVMRAQDVGARTSIVLGKQSGRHAFESWLMQRGVALAGHAFERAFELFKRLADTTGQLSEQQILDLARRPRAGTVRLQAIEVVQAANGPGWTATVCLVDQRGQVHEGRGNGQLVQAISRAIAVASGLPIEVVSSNAGSRSQGDGTQAFAQVDLVCAGLALNGQAIAATEHEAIAHAILDVIPMGESGRLEVLS